MKPVKQIYANYTPQDFLVWETLFNRQLKNLESKVSDEFIQALHLLDFTPKVIPDFEKVNKKLATLTGWQLHTVPEISEAKEFFYYLSQKKFTATCWLRTIKQLDYIEEPDMFHDVFGHVPLLSNNHYSTFFEAIGKLSLKYIHQSDIVVQLQRLYWFTIEFGLIEENNVIKVFGAGIISSKEETENALSNKTLKTEFNLGEILEHPFKTDVVQNHYYVIQSFDQLNQSFKQLELELEEIYSEV